MKLHKQTPRIYDPATGTCQVLVAAGSAAYSRNDYFTTTGLYTPAPVG